MEDGRNGVQHQQDPKEKPHRREHGRKKKKDPGSSIWRQELSQSSAFQVDDFMGTSPGTASG